MKVLFMGTPEFAVASLSAVHEAGFDIVGVISQPDKPKKRKMNLLPTPVKEYAVEHGLEVYQPESLKNEAILPYLEKTAPDVIAVVAYGKLLPEYILNFPKFGCINIHASLLPAYRGAAPIHHALINGESVTGVTSMVMDRSMDTGGTLLKKEVEIKESDDFNSLYPLLAEEGGKLLVETLKALGDGQIKEVPQNDDEATYAPMIERGIAKIDWGMDAKDIVNLVRGICAWPVAHSFLGEVRFRVHKAEVSEKSGLPGEVLDLSGGITVAAGRGAVKILQLQFDNKRKMTADEYLAGNKLEAGMIIGGESVI